MSLLFPLWLISAAAIQVEQVSSDIQFLKSLRKNETSLDVPLQLLSSFEFLFYSLIKVILVFGFASSPWD